MLWVALSCQELFSDPQYAVIAAKIHLLVHMEQKNTSTTQTQPCTMSGNKICRDNKKYEGSGAVVYNLLCCRDRAVHIGAMAADRTMPARAVAVDRTPGKKIPPPLTVLNKAVTSSNKCVINHITLAVVHAPVKKKSPSSFLPCPGLLWRPCPFHFMSLRQGHQLRW